MEFLPLDRMNSRIALDREESDTDLFNSLLLKAEMMTKLTVIGLLSTIPNDVDNTRYAYTAELVRANSIGTWADILRRLLTGPVTLPEGIRITQNQLIERRQRGTWQHQAVKDLNNCLKHLNPQHPRMAKSIQLMQWFNDFANLRNSTRGHGAKPPSVISEVCPIFERSLTILENNLNVFDIPWAYIHQNLSGKYRVTYWSKHSENLEVLKSRVDQRLQNGIYLDSGTLHRVELITSDIDATDIWLANGKFNDSNYEMISYWSGDLKKESSAPYLVPADSLPSSETEGLGKLDVTYNTFNNLPPAPSRYIGRQDLEQQLRKQLSTVDRNPVVTLTGYGGIGKTYLALTVISQMMNEGSFPYDIVVWFSARDVDLLPSGPKLVRPVGLSVEDFAREYVRLLEPNTKDDGWKSNEKYFASQLGDKSDFTTLFVFDNFETVSSPAGLYEWIDTYIRHPNKILITSRQRSFRGDYPLHVSGMTEDECIRLIDDTSSILGIKNRITINYKRQIIEQSAGHPYVIKIFLGEFARNPGASSVQHVVARQEQVLNALFDRSYNRLGQAAQMVFLTLCSWKSSVPRIGLEAVLLRPENEQMNIDSAIDELLQMSMIEEITSESSEVEGELTTPLAARLFGLKKLEVSPWRALIRANSELLQLFGPVAPTQAVANAEARIVRFVKMAAQHIEGGRSSLEEILPILEYLSRQLSIGWVLMADLVDEFGGAEREGEVVQYLMNYVENPDSPSYPATDVWRRIAFIHSRGNNLYEALDALAHICRQPNITTDELSDTVREINQFFRFNDTADLTRNLRQILLQDVVDAMERRVDILNGDDCSRLAWLYMNLGEVSAAQKTAELGLSRDPDNQHCFGLLERFS